MLPHNLFGKGEHRVQKDHLKMNHLEYEKLLAFILNPELLFF